MALPRLRTAVLAGLLSAGLTASGLLAACASTGREVAALEPAAAEAPTTTTEPPRAVPDPVAGALRAEIPAAEEGAEETPGPVLLFGDSVAVLVADELAAGLDAPITVDGLDCRRLDRGFSGPCGGVPAGTDVAAGLDDLVRAAEALDDPADTTAVVVLANNAALSRADLDAAMAGLEGLRRVWWVTTRVDGRGWQDPNNRLLVELAARDPRAGVIDWFARSEGRDWLADHVHPDDDGQAALAELVAAHVSCDCTP